MKSQTLEQQFYDLKAEVLKKMKSKTYLHFYMNGEGSGFILESSDKLSHKFAMTGTPSAPFDIKEIVDAYRVHIKRQLTYEQCLQMAIIRFKEILAEMDKNKSKESK